MQALNPGFTLPVPARFGHTPTARPLAHFSGSTPADDLPPASEPDAGPKKQNPLDALLQGLTNQGLVKGAQQFAGTLTHVLTWNKLLDEADPESSIPSRLLAVLDIAYARFREGYNSQDAATETADPVNYKLYQNVLTKFPGLALKEDLPLDLSAQLVAASDDPETLQASLDELKETYADVSQIPAGELKEKVADALG